jgi:hypothetical protein
MAPGNPPRHSKSTEGPVTIDLDAQEIASANDTENDVQRPVAPEASLAAETDAQKIADQETSDQQTADQDPLPPHISSTYTADEPPLDQPRPQSGTASGNTSGLIAAGIVGGLIALVGAGAIQYAGYLPGASRTPSPSADVANLSGEIEGLKRSVSNLAATPPAGPDEALEVRLAALESAVKAPPPAAATDTATIDALSRKIADLTGQIDQLRGAVSQATEQRASNGVDIETRLAEAEKKLNEPRQDVAVAQAIAAAALKAAIDRGGPFVSELDTYAGVSADDPVVTDLRNFAETGVPSRAELIRQVPDVANAIGDSVNRTDPNQSWSDRLMTSAKSLVKVRPVGNIEGDSVEAIAARMEDKVKNGDLPGAAAQWNDLPASAKQASAAFKQALEARIRVEDLVGSALSKAISGTGKEG